MPELYVVMTNRITRDGNEYDRKRAIVWPGVGVFSYQLIMKKREKGRRQSHFMAEFRARGVRYLQPDEPYAKFVTAAVEDGLREQDNSRVSYVLNVSFETAEPPESLGQLQELRMIKERQSANAAPDAPAV